MALRQFNGRTVNVGAFTAAVPGQSEIVCRAVGPIKTPDGEPFSEYVRKALVDEMKIAGIYNPTAPVSITGRLDQADFGSMSGTWSLMLTLTSTSTTWAFQLSMFEECASLPAGGGVADEYPWWWNGP